MNYSINPAIDPLEIVEALSAHPTAVKPFEHMVNKELAQTAEGNKHNVSIATRRQRENVLPLASVVKGEEGI